MADNNLCIFSGNSNPKFAEGVCKYLGVPEGKIKVKKFSDGETQIEIDENVRMGDVFVIQSTCMPVNDNLVDLLLIADALKRASAKRITAVIPYFGYARQDKKVEPRVPISAKLVADVLQVSGIHRVITMDMHANQLQGFFNIPVDHLFARPVLVKYIRENFFGKIVMVAPDAGGVERVRAYAKLLDAGLAIVDKRRKAPNWAKAMNLIGDVSDAIAIILDDMVDTAGTIVEAAECVLAKGAKEVHGMCSHPVLSGDGRKKIGLSNLKSFIATDSIPIDNPYDITVLSMTEIFGEAIIRSHRGDSVTSLFI